MKRVMPLLLALLAFAPRSAPAQDEQVDADAWQATLLFVMQVATYQGYFDSVANHCEPHAPAHILQRAREQWRRDNGDAVTLREREMTRLVDEARANGMSAENFANLVAWPAKHYEASVQRDKFHKDLPGMFDGDLALACTQRLGEMLAGNMTLERIAPDAWAYLQKHAGR